MREDICVENSNSIFSSAIKFRIPLPNSLNFPAFKVAEKLLQNDFFTDSIGNGLDAYEAFL
jgi:membrane carboxypeptidase/penicillin-binding protein PbpC